MHRPDLRNTRSLLRADVDYGPGRHQDRVEPAQELVELQRRHGDYTASGSPSRWPAEFGDRSWHDRDQKKKDSVRQVAEHPESIKYTAVVFDEDH